MLSDFHTIFMQKLTFFRPIGPSTESPGWAHVALFIDWLISSFACSNFFQPLKFTGKIWTLDLLVNTIIYSHKIIYIIAYKL